jgi:hypothetical protein
MILMALINVATATEPVDNTQLDSLIQAKPAAVEMSVAGPAEAVAEATTETATTPEAVSIEAAATNATPVLTESTPTPVDVTAETTLIDWESDGSNAILTETTSEKSTSSNTGVSLVMVPVSLGLMGIVFFFRKRVFNQIQAPSKSDPMNVVARKATGNQSAIFLVDVADLEGGTRRLLIGSSPNGNSLLADVSPSNAIFPEPLFEQSPMADSAERQSPPALHAVQNDEPKRESARELLDFGPKRALIDELISSSEKSSFRPRSMKKAYTDSPTVSTDPNSEEKRRAAQAVLDEVLAERRAGNQGTQVRVTA